MHGHNWIMTIYCKSKELNQDGMIVDFSHVKDLVSNKLDHQNLNDVLDFNPTAENIAKWVVERVPHCYRADVQESNDNVAIFIKDEMEGTDPFCK